VQIADNLPLEKFSTGELEDLYQYARRKNISIEIGGRGLDPDIL